MKIDKEKLVRRLKKTGIISIWILMISGIIVSQGFVNKKEKEITCTKVLIDINPEIALQFVDREMIIKIISPDGNENNIIGSKITALNTPLLEQKLRENEIIRSAQVFTDMNGILHIHIDQRVPVIRIINSKNESYYIDRDGAKMPESPVFTARVPVASGNIFESYDNQDSIQSFVGRELYKIATYVDKDAFWKAQIGQIFVNQENELILVPTIGDHTILFGTTENMEDKFSKLMLFYKEALSRIGWDKYSSIDLRYKAQIVCKKKNK